MSDIIELALKCCHKFTCKIDSLAYTTPKEFTFREGQLETFAAEIRREQDKEIERQKEDARNWSQVANERGLEIEQLNRVYNESEADWRRLFTAKDEEIIALHGEIEQLKDRSELK